MDIRELVREVRRASRATDRAKAAYEQARAQRDEAIRAAMAVDSPPVKELLEAAGFKERARLYQIKDGKRTLAKDSEKTV